jgi:cation:H+ antiporter
MAVSVRSGLGGRADIAVGNVAFVCVIGGRGLLVLGATWLVDSAVSVARAVGISDAVIGLTIVAAGTILPELAPSVVAAIRGERDIAVGNAVGSSVFNLLGILGIAALVTAGGLSVAPALVNFDIPVMIAVAFACLPIFATGHRSRAGKGPCSRAIVRSTRLT